MSELKCIGKSDTHSEDFPIFGNNGGFFNFFSTRNLHDDAPIISLTARVRSVYDRNAQETRVP